MRTIFLILSILYYSPVLMAYYWGGMYSIISRDLVRWLELTNSSLRSDTRGFIHIFQKLPEFRNLFYFRLRKGSRLNRAISQVLGFFYSPCPSLFISQDSNIGEGLFIQHGFSTIIMADIGQNCWINQQVSIGYKDRSGRPTLGDNVRIGAGAKVLGHLSIGDRSTIGANAVVTKDIPPGCVAVGVPARVIKRDGQRVESK